MERIRHARTVFGEAPLFCSRLCCVCVVAAVCRDGISVSDNTASALTRKRRRRHATAADAGVVIQRHNGFLRSARLVRNGEPRRVHSVHTACSGRAWCVAIASQASVNGTRGVGAKQLLLPPRSLLLRVVLLCRVRAQRAALVFF